jgi:hypothetical protein
MGKGGTNSLGDHVIPQANGFICRTFLPRPLGCPDCLPECPLEAVNTDHEAPVPLICAQEVMLGWLI